jgi:iron complex transport system substrate-binding protein
MIRRRALLAATALALPFAARAQDRRTITDGADRRVEMPSRPQRVFAAGPGAAVLIVAVAPDRLAGWPLAPFPPTRALLPAALTERPVLGRLTGAQALADAARVRASGADLVLDMGTVDATYAGLADRVQAEAGVPYVLLDGALARSAALLAQTGEVLNARARAAAIAHGVTAALDRSAAQVAGWTGPRLWYGRGPRGLEVAPAALINNEVPRLLNCRLPPVATPSWSAATEQALQDFDPQVALLPDASTAAAVRADPAWAGTAAVRQGQVLAMPNGPFGWVDGPPSVQRVLGLRWLLSALRPDVLPAAEMRAEAAGLLALLFGVAADDAVLDALVGQG